MSRQERRWLVASIRDQLLPAFYAQGFNSVALTDQENSGELPEGYPFGKLRRARDPGIDAAEIVMARYGRPAFAICAGVVPLGGIEHPVLGHFTAEDVWASHLPRHYAICQVPFLQRWFSLWHWPRRQVAQSDVTALVASVSATVVQEIDDALRKDRCGKHVRRMGW